MDLQVFPSLFGNVFRPFHGVAQSLVAAGNDSHHPRFRHTERRGQFAGIQHTQASAGSCTDVKQPSAALHPLLNGSHQRLNLWNGLVHDISHPAILFIDVLQQFSHRHSLQMVEVRWLFSDLLHHNDT